MSNNPTTPLGVDGSTAFNPKDFSQYLGIASWPMSMSKEHRDLPYSTLDHKILPAVLLKQFKIIEKGNVPIAFVTWASVSDAVKEKLTNTDERLSLAEWRSGKNLIITECISPYAPADKLKADFFARLNSKNNS